MRDTFTKAGMTPQAASQQAEQFKQQLWAAEKKGPQATAQVADQIQRMLAGGR
jgi:hypothetical protein